MWKKLCWRLKIGWVCVGGHYINKLGEYAHGEKIYAYHYVWYNERTQETRSEDRCIT